MATLIDFILHIDAHLVNIVNTFGNWTYIILFVIIFVETGAVILPFLPGDSLLFAAAALSANPTYKLDIGLFISLFLIAAAVGDSLNYFLGSKASIILQRYPWFKKFIKEDQLHDAQSFFDKHGIIGIFLARFMPIIRTFAPFIAGGSGFTYRHFVKYNLSAVFTWVILFCGTGYFFGNISFVKDHFSMVVIGIILVSLVPAVYTFVKGKLNSAAQTK